MPNFDRARQAVQKLVKEKAKVDKLEVSLGIADALAGAAEAASGATRLTGLSDMAGTFSLLKSIADSDDNNVIPNINFVYSEQEDPNSPITAEYFRGRSLKSIGGSTWPHRPAPPASMSFRPSSMAMPRASR